MTADLKLPISSGSWCHPISFPSVPPTQLWLQWQRKFPDLFPVSYIALAFSGDTACFEFLSLDLRSTEWIQNLFNRSLWWSTESVLRSSDFLLPLFPVLLLEHCKKTVSLGLVCCQITLLPPCELPKVGIKTHLSTHSWVYITLKCYTVVQVVAEALRVSIWIGRRLGDESSLTSPQAE